MQQYAKTVGFYFCCLVQYAVYRGTHKIIARTVAVQYEDPECYHVQFNLHQPGDLVFNDGVLLITWLSYLDQTLRFMHQKIEIMPLKHR
jgi:hypothetical protein